MGDEARLRNEHPDNILSLDDTIRMVVDVVSDDGNIEFNLGPKADGTLAAFEVERLRAMGAWLKVNGEAIYGTRKSPFGAQSFGRTTFDASRNRLYVLVDEWPTDGVLEVKGATAAPTAARLLAAPDRAVRCDPLDGGGLRLQVPGEAPDTAVSVIAIDYEGEIR